MENKKLSEALMDLIISYTLYPLRGLHNLAYDNVNSAMVNGWYYEIDLRLRASDVIGNAQYEKV